MVIDLHSHYVPLQAANEADVGISLDEQPDGEVRFSTANQTMTLEGALFDLEIQKRDIARQRLDRRILAVPPFCFQYELPREAGIRWARALNDGTAEAARSDPASFVGFATLPLADVAASVEELGRAHGDLGLRGVEIGSNINGVELDAPSLDRLWERVESLDLPVLVHPHYVVGPERMGDYYLRNLTGNPFDTALAGARLILGGVLERYPDLTIILSHGGGALPIILGRIFHGYRVREESKARANDPRTSAGRLFYDTIVFEPSALRYLVEVFGARQVILGTDYPFDMSLDDPMGFIEGSGVDAETVETIKMNGERLLGE